jgi:hypothetical protein
MNRLTGNKNLDFAILNQLTDRDLGVVCQVNSYVRNLCNDNTFWMTRFYLKYKILSNSAIEIKNYLEFTTWKEFYVWLNKFNLLDKDLLTLVKNLENTEMIDHAIYLTFEDIELPLWINRQEYIKEFKRYCFINVSEDINTAEAYDPEYEDFSDYDLLASMLIKANYSMNEIILDSTVHESFGKLVKAGYEETNILRKLDIPKDE